MIQYSCKNKCKGRDNMLSDNIRYYRKKNNLSQEELAEKIGVSRQSVSFWETGQTQPTIDNIIALSKIFHITSDMLLGNTSNAEVVQNEPPESKPTEKRSIKASVIVIGIICIVIATALICAVFLGRGNAKTPAPEDTKDTESEIVTDTTNIDTEEPSDTISDEGTEDTVPPAISDTEEPTDTVTPVGTEDTVPPTASDTEEPTDTIPSVDTKDTVPPVTSDIEEPTETATPVDTEDTAPPVASDTEEPTDTTVPTTTETPSVVDTKPFDLFSYCKSFAIEIGRLNGDYCIYQQPATKYGGYPNEYFSISYWADSDMVEFCLHCPLDETTSHNFYLRMRGGYNKTYEYLSSKYYRDTGVGFRDAMGYIDPAVFSDHYPISCDLYEGSANGQDQFMEDTRIGICDLIRCLKNFVTVEQMDCDFSDFDFVNF